MQNELILASASPRRVEILKLMGIRFIVCPAEVDENLEGSPEDVVRTLAVMKAQKVSRENPNRFVLAADTLVHCNGKTLGKPKDKADASRMLHMLSDNCNNVFTGVCLIREDGAVLSSVVKTNVRFCALTDEDIEHYIISGEPMDKAGAYAIQGMGGMFIKSIEGSMSNVIGLPMHTVREMLTSNGFKLYDKDVLI